MLGRFVGDRQLVSLAFFCMAGGGALAALAQGFGQLALGRLASGAGFVFGTIRTLTTAGTPDARLLAVAIELPAIITVAWFACRHTIRHFNVPRESVGRLAMGAIAFGILMLAELLLDFALAGRSASEHFALYAEPSHILGLAGQVGFALLPLIQARSGIQ